MTFFRSSRASSCSGSHTNRLVSFMATLEPVLYMFTPVSSAALPREKILLVHVLSSSGPSS